MSDDGGTEPRWWAVVEGIADLIRSDRWPIGTKLPPPEELGPHWGVTRNTAVRARSHLVELGVLETVVGRGTYVRALPPADLRRPRGVSETQRLRADVDDLRRRVERLEGER